MIKRTRNKLPDAKLNDLVVLHVIEVDRGPTDPAIKINAIKITNITSSTILENMGEVLKKKSIGIREAVRLLSIGIGQGFQHCDCTTKCIIKRSSCMKADVDCNSS